MLPPNYVLATLIWISFMIVSCRNFYGQPIRAQLELNETDSLSSCLFPAAIRVTLTTSGLTSDLPKLLHYTLVKSWNSSGVLPSWLPGRLSLEKEDQSVADGIQKFVHYDSVTNDLHISAKCTQKSNHHTSFTFVGIIIYNSEAFVIRPHSIIPSSLFRPLDIAIYRINDGTPLSAKKSVQSRFEPPPNMSASSRSRRAVLDLTTFTIELLVVVDYSVFVKWQSRLPEGSTTDRTKRIKEEITKYYGHVVDGVDSRYRNIAFSDFTIRVKLVEVFIMEQKLLHPGPSTSNKINADTALKALRKWTNETRKLPSFDHAMLFVGYDLYTNTSKDNDTVSHTSGLAYIGTMCLSGDSVSVVEEQGGFQSIGTAAHELGHSLGALHDGEQNPCHSEDRYIMAASGFGPVPSDRQRNPWRFSSCSVEYFRSFMASHLSDGSLCLLDSEAPGASLTQEGNSTNSTTISQDDDSELPGQHYTPDEQCRLIWGPQSYLCRGSEFGNPSSLCTAMYCRDPATVNDCVLHTAARGTSCGDKKWCLDGKCEYSEKASAKPAHCILGDQPGKAFNGMSCEELVDQRPSYCYQEKVRARCCQSCNRKSHPRKGCEFGDRIQGCRPWHCSYASQSGSILSDCCGTCNAGEVTVSTQAPVVRQDDLPSETVTQSTKMSECVDHGDVNGVTCREYVQTYGGYICYYEESWRTQCCSTCAEIQSTKQGCEYGDKTPMLCAKIANITTLRCSTFGHQCCESCSDDEDRTSAGQSIGDLNFLVLSLEFVIMTMFIK